MRRSLPMSSWAPILVLASVWGGSPVERESDTRAYTAQVEVRWPQEECDCEVARAEASPAREVAPDVSKTVEPPAAERGEAAARERSGAEFDLNFSGLVGIVGSRGTGGFTFGGPRIGLRVGKFAIGLSFYPSLTYSTYRDRHRIRPHLGFGLELAYAGFTLFAPVYHIEDHYVPAAGLGYRFELIRKVKKRDKTRNAEKGE
jgi:hypothetical protein